MNVWDYNVHISVSLSLGMGDGGLGRRLQLCRKAQRSTDLQPIIRQ